MRLCRVRVLAPLLGVLAPLACTPVVRSTPSTDGRVASPPVPGAPVGVTAFVDVAVVPMDQERVLPHQTVLVEGGRITALGPVDQIAVPAGATRIEGRGKYLIPGLADMHAHLLLGVHILGGYLPLGDSVGAETKLFLWLANGVTTIRNMDHEYVEEGRQALRLRALAATGGVWMPRIYTAGPWAKYGTDTSVAARIAAYQAAGYDFIKAYGEQGAELDSLVIVAHRLGIPVAGHVPGGTRVEHAIQLGYKSIEHPLTTWIWGKRTSGSSHDTAGIGVLAAAMRRADVWHCPTQGHYERRHQQDEFPSILKVEQDSGVRLLLGTDELPWQGVITRELQAMVAAGLTPYQALLTGTRNVAVYFGTLAESGTIAVGKRADLVLLTGNPLRDVRYTAQPAGVMLGGRWLPRAEIDRRIARLTLPTHIGLLPSKVMEEPVQSYWQNVIDEVVQTSGSRGTIRLFLSDQQEDSEIKQLAHWIWQPTLEAQRQALSDSLGASDHYKAGTQRVFRLIAQQLGVERLALTPTQRALFDQQARVWIQRRHREGYSVAIPGVQP